MLDDTDVLIDSLAEWKRPDLLVDRPPPLVIDIYIDAGNLSPNQALIATDDEGKRWDITDALRAGSEKGRKAAELIVERWIIQLDPTAPSKADEQLPNVYKKGVVLFRSLYAYLRMLPAWKLHRRLARQSGSNGGLRLKYRLRQGSSSSPSSLDLPPLFPTTNAATTRTSPSTTSSSEEDGSFTLADRSRHEQRRPAAAPSSSSTSYNFPGLGTPGGSCTILHRLYPLRDLSVGDREASLSSIFLSLDQGLPTLQGGRSLPKVAASSQPQYDRPSTPAQTAARQPRALLGTYGSLNTYHNTTIKRGSPISALRRRGSDESESSAMVSTTREKQSPLLSHVSHVASDGTVARS